MKKQIKRITAVAAAAALAISFTFPAELGLADLGVGGNAIAASAASSGNCGDSGSNVTWLLDDNGTLTISGSGKIEDYRSDIDQPWYSNRSDITSVVIEPGVTSIGSLAFYECSNLTSITIPSGLTSIGEQAFGNCTGLTSITIPSGFISIGHWRLCFLELYRTYKYNYPERRYFYRNRCFLELYRTYKHNYPEQRYFHWS